MYLNQTNVTFTNIEKIELEDILKTVKFKKKGSQPSSPILNRQDQLFKKEMICCFKSMHAELQKRKHIGDKLNELLLWQRCCKQKNQPNETLCSEQIEHGMQALKIKINEKEKINQIFFTFVSFVEQIKELKEDKLYEFQYNLSKALNLNRIERQILAGLAKKMVKVDSLIKLNNVVEDISSFLTKIIKYGISQQFGELQSISSNELKIKCVKLVQYLQNNCIELRHELSPARQILKELSVSIYDDKEILSKLNKLPQKLKQVFEPICNEVIRLRLIQKRHEIVGSQNGLIFISSEMKNAQEESIRQLVKDCNQSKRQSQRLSLQLQLIRQVIQKFNSLSQLFKEEAVYDDIEKKIQAISLEFQDPLERVYKHLRNYEQLSLGKRQASFVERKDQQIEFLRQKLKTSLQQIEELKNLLSGIDTEEKIDLAKQFIKLKKEEDEYKNTILQYQQEMNKLTPQLAESHKKIKALQSQIYSIDQKYQIKTKQNEELAKQVQSIMNLKKNEETEEQQKQHLLTEQKAKQHETTKIKNKQLQHISNKYKQQMNKQMELYKEQLKENSELKLQIKRLNQVTASGNKVVTLDESQINERYEALKKENDNLKQERVLRLAEESQMKRVYKQYKENLQKDNQTIAQYKEKCENFEHLNKKYKEKQDQSNSSSRSDVAILRENQKRLQESNKVLHNNLEELKKYNDLLKAEYHRHEEEIALTIKKKVQEELKAHKNEVDRQNFKQKIKILQEQNLALKIQIQQNKKGKKQMTQSQLNKSENLTDKPNDKDNSQQQARQMQKHYKGIIQQLKTSITQKNEEIANLRIQTLKLQQKLEK